MVSKTVKVLIAVVIVIIAVIYNSLTKRKAPSPIVEVSTGKLQGVVSTSRSGREFYEYLGIPYAKPPLNELRFELPQPAEKWEGVLDASQFRAKCIQVDMVTQFFEGDENCLFLNINVPKVAESKKPLPVMVFIHGGIFMFGGADRFGPKYFMDEDVILVTIQYRVAALGFLNTGDGVVRGNMGLKDQTLALKWVQQNIKSFGGDPGKVTLFGESAGASSVHLHMISPMSKGLFQRAISQSGTALCPWVLRRNPAKQAKRFASQLNCPTNDTKMMVDCLKKKDAYTIGEIHRETLDLLHESIAVFSATVEVQNDSNTFLADEPRNLLKSGKIANKVPWITGVNADEGLILSSALVHNETMLNELQNKWLDVLPKFFFYGRNDEISKQAKNNYFGKKKYFGKAENFQIFTRMLSDRSFFFPIHASAKLQSKHAPIYLYYYTHVGDFSIANFLLHFRGNLPFIVEIMMAIASAWVNKNILGRRPPVLGVCHSDEQPMMFNMAFTPDLTPEDAEQYEMSVSIVKLWSSFAKHEKELNFRGARWSPVEPNKDPLRYFHLDMSYGMVDEPFSRRINFWKTLQENGFNE